MFWNKKKKGLVQQESTKQTLALENQPLSIEEFKKMLEKMDDAEIIEPEKNDFHKLTLIYIRTLIDLERLNESIIEPLNRSAQEQVLKKIAASKITEVTSIAEANKQLFSGAVLIYDPANNVWAAIPLKNPLGRSIETSETETILYGAKDSFSENIEDNISLIRHRLPIPRLKTEKFTVGSLSQSTAVIMYIEGLTNPEFIETAKKKIEEINFDLFFDSSQLAAFMEENGNSIFPQFQQTDRPDVCAYSLGLGKITILLDNTPFVLVAPITFFHLFQSPEDYINRWPVASFLRCIRYLSFFISITLIPFYVALTTHHYQMIPLQILFVLMESRTKLPFSPFWEAFLMLIILEIIKEASLRMPTKSSQTLGVIGGIVIGQAAVEAGFASKVLIVMVGISTIASFLIPNYLMTKANSLILFSFLILSSFLGIFGIAIGLILLFAHLNGLNSLKEPYFSPVAPFYGKDWNDLFIRGPLTKMKERPEHLHPVQKWRYSQRRLR
ncbi:spore germination protein [Metabacillus idriensis]|uniref:spore germination protein n=1 Tax=Metabacillus idriensis TaxID=324768 RepID=UPI0017499BD3|nr:spore germination protein [Metabacillus idriensis]